MEKNEIIDQKDEQTQTLTPNKMGTRSMFPLIISMALPAMFSMMIQALYNVVDSYFVAQISENALTAVSLVFPIQSLLIALGIGTAIGINSLVSRRLGEQNFAEANSAATHGILLGLLNYIVFFIVGFFSRPFIGLFTNTPEVIEMGTQYMQIVCFFSFGVFVEVNIEKSLQATGNMLYPMMFQLIGAVTNIILDPIFIFGLFGVPKMSVAGAAIATVLGQILAMIIALIVLTKKEHEITVSFHHFHINTRIVKNIYEVGLPSIVMQSIGSVMVMGINAILMSYTETAVAFFGVYFKLQSFIFMPVFGLNQGIMPIIGYNFGAQNKSRMKDCLRYGTIIAVVIMIIGVVVFWTIPNLLLGIFNASDVMLSIGVPALKTISLCFIPAAIGITFSGEFQAVGKGTYSLLVSLLRQLCILLPAAYLLSVLTHSLPSIWYAFPIAEFFSCIASILLHNRIKKKMLSKF
ncbi:MAG: MATE family efflux transporter [Oscillospiraceae bacterium]|jgi:putative MATE family efflux protein